MFPLQIVTQERKGCVRDREQELWAKERGTFSGLCISAQPLCCAIPVHHVLLSPPTSAPIWVSWHGALPPASGPYFSFPPPLIPMLVFAATPRGARGEQRREDVSNASTQLALSRCRSAEGWDGIFYPFQTL